MKIHTKFIMSTYLSKEFFRSLTVLEKYFLDAFLKLYPRKIPRKLREAKRPFVFLLVDIYQSKNKTERIREIWNN